MIELSPSQLDGYAREVAGQVAEGYSFEQIARALDLAVHELEEVFDSEPFTEYLETYGSSVVEAFKETRAASRAGSFHRKISERFDTYYEALDGLAMDKSLKPEKRADILLTLMKYVAPADQEQAQAVRMPPALIENWVRRNQEYEAAAKAGLGTEHPGGISPPEGRTAEGQGVPVLLRLDGDADDGLDSGATSTLRKFHSDEPVERGAGGKPEEVSVDAEGALQIIDRFGSIPFMASHPRQKHVNRSNLLKREEHKEVARRDKEHN